MTRIIADSTCDLTQDLIKKYNIEILPLYVRLNDEEYLDGINIKPEKIYEWSDSCGETPKTAAPSVNDVIELLNKNTKDDIVIFTISASMSVAFNNCKLAAEELGISNKVHVIDSENLSTGIGLLVLQAAEMAAEGKSAAEIEKHIFSIRSKVRASFVVDTLTYLYRGGRCTGLAALFGTALKLHPRIAVVNGAMRPEKKYRGNPAKYVMDYVEDMNEALKNAEHKRVFITHSGCDKTIVDMVRQYLESMNIFDQIIETRAGSVISSHCGPGTLGVLFISK